MKKIFLFLIALLPLLFLINSCKQDSYVQFTSSPPGALVEIGVDVEGNKFKPGTGRQVGATPVKVVLEEEDISDDGMLYYIMKRGGLTTIGQINVGKPLVAGKIFTYHQKY